jgi:hypothetical protein
MRSFHPTQHFCHSSTLEEDFKCYIFRAICLKRSSARLVEIHRCFIAPSYRTSWGGGCSAAGPFPLHSES